MLKRRTVACQNDVVFFRFRFALLPLFTRYFYAGKRFLLLLNELIANFVREINFSRTSRLSRRESV